MNRKAYRATCVNNVSWEQLARGREGLGITLGVDVGKYSLWPVCRWADGRFERPWRVKNPDEIPALLALVKRMRMRRKLVVAMESSGTYGDALRQALAESPRVSQRRPGRGAFAHVVAARRFEPPLGGHPRSKQAGSSGAFPFPQIALRPERLANSGTLPP